MAQMPWDSRYASPCRMDRPLSQRETPLITWRSPAAACLTASVVMTDEVEDAVAVPAPDVRQRPSTATCPETEAVVRDRRAVVVEAPVKVGAHRAREEKKEEQQQEEAEEEGPDAVVVVAGATKKQEVGQWRKEDRERRPRSSMPRWTAIGAPARMLDKQLRRQGRMLVEERTRSPRPLVQRTT